MFYNVKRKTDIIASKSLGSNVILNARAYIDFLYFVEFGICFTTKHEPDLR